VDPNLIPPGQTSLGVPALTTGPTAPLPPIRTSNGEKVAYFCEIPNATMHRNDGKRIPFLWQFYETDLLHDILYLENEIAAGNTLVRHATDEEKHNYRVRTEPKTVMREQVTAELQANLASDLEKKIRAQVKKELGQPLTDEEEKLLAQAAAVTDEKKLQGTETLHERLERIRAQGKQVVTKGNTTVIMESKAPPISPVSTAQLTGNVPVSGK
jgi:hypothetical protein